MYGQKPQEVQGVNIISSRYAEERNNERAQVSSEPTSSNHPLKYLLWSRIRFLHLATLPAYVGSIWESQLYYSLLTQGVSQPTAADDKSLISSWAERIQEDAGRACGGNAILVVQGRCAHHNHMFRPRRGNLFKGNP